MSRPPDPCPSALAVGQKSPQLFRPATEFGHVQSLETLKGPNGTVLLFFRLRRTGDPSAKGSWSQLQSAYPRFEKQGVKFAAIRLRLRGNPEILRPTATKSSIRCSADPDSKIIKAYSVFNHEAHRHAKKDSPAPAISLSIATASSREKFFEAKYRERLTGKQYHRETLPPNSARKSPIP